MEKSTLKAIIPVFFLISIIAFIVISVVLNYHWTRYGITKDGVKKLRKVYYGVSSLILFIMTISLIIFLLND